MESSFIKQNPPLIRLYLSARNLEHLRRGTVRDLQMISNERKNMWQASNPYTRLEYAMPENQPLVQNFRFTGKSVSSDSIRACSHKVLSPPISHATSLLARPTQTPVRRAARVTRPATNCKLNMGYSTIFIQQLVNPPKTNSPKEGFTEGLIEQLVNSPISNSTGGNSTRP